MHIYKNTLPHKYTHSNFLSPYLYYISDESLYKTNIFSLVSECIRKVDTLDILSIDILGSIKKYLLIDDDILVLSPKNVLYKISKNLSKDFTCVCLSEDITDFCVSDKFLYLVSKNKIFKKYLLSYKISLSSPMLVINTGNTDIVIGVEIRKYFYISYDKYIEVYDINEDILLLKYRYNTSEGFHIFRCNKIYLVDKDVLILEEYPMIIYQGRVREIYQNNEEDILISNEYIIINHKEVLINDKKIIRHSTSILKDLNTSIVIRSTDTEKSIINKYDTEILDRYRILYYELSTLNDSLVLKKDKLDILYNEITIEGGDIKKYIGVVEEEMKKKTKKTDEKYLRILKMQKELLKKKVIIKYKIFLSSNIESDDILGLSLVMYCDINNINIPDRIIDYYFHVLVNNRMKDEDIMRSIQEENDIYKEKIDVESEIVKDAWYEMSTQSENTNNDEAYLKEEDKSVKKSAERSTVKKKCANCTCGMDNKPVENRVSACGGCHKGDAFRCSGCPYMGMPSFNEGDTIRFD
ncbi:hypothetical protein P3W45_000769 [Vairimorpha bombi]